MYVQSDILYSLSKQTLVLARKSWPTLKPPRECSNLNRSIVSVWPAYIDRVSTCLIYVAPPLPYMYLHYLSPMTKKRLLKVKIHLLTQITLTSLTLLCLVLCGRFYSSAALTAASSTRYHHCTFSLSANRYIQLTPSSPYSGIYWCWERRGRGTMLCEGD